MGGTQRTGQEPDGRGGRAGPPAWLPNAITGWRVLLIPATLICAWSCATAVARGEDGGDWRALAVLGFVAIGASDVLDGWLARRYGLCTNLGATMDAAADKLAQVSLLVFFAFSDGSAFPVVPLWFVLIVFGADLFLGVGAAIVRRRLGRVRVVHELHGRLVSLLLYGLALALLMDVGRSVLDELFALVALGKLVSTAKYFLAGLHQRDDEDA